MKSTIECYAALPTNIFLCVTNDGYVRKENCDGEKAPLPCDSISNKLVWKQFLL
jgi:hypothetical protein